VGGRTQNEEITRNTALGTKWQARDKMMERKHSPVDIKKGLINFLQRHTDRRIIKPALKHWFL